tara:strand:+ start:294 stop:923 length:630 start_codon:yes stop_codon:yes gene_type:complete
MRENEFLPDCKFYYRENNPNFTGIDKTDWVIKTTNDIFKDKKCLVFSVPGPFTPLCSAFQLPNFEKHYNDFKFEYGIDEVYCHSVSDIFVMKAWFKEKNIKNVKILPDGNGDFARLLGMYVNRSDYGMGMRSWRCAFITDNTKIEYMFSEPFPEDNLDHDPYNESSPQNILEYLRRKKAGIDIKKEHLYPYNVAVDGGEARVLGLKDDD